MLKVVLRLGYQVEISNFCPIPDTVRNTYTEDANICTEEVKQN